MDKKEKKQKLKGFAVSIIENPKHKKEIDYILKNLNLTKEKVIQAYLDYDMDTSVYENKIYESLVMRVVLHVHNLLKESWHEERQKEVLRILNEMKGIKTIVDMGFGTPQRYVKDFVFKNKNIRLELVDLYESAIQFGKILLDFWNPSWNKQVNFKKLDMNTHKFIGKFDVYVFQDSVEHVDNSTEYLKKTVNLAPKNARFIFSLPIGPPPPVHTIAWYSVKELKKWLSECGLKVNKTKRIDLNQKVDLFAAPFEKESYEVIMECEKR